MIAKWTHKFLVAYPFLLETLCQFMVYLQSVSDRLDLGKHLVEEVLDGSGNLYMQRFLLYVGDEKRVYIHKFFKSDMAYPHSHPWYATLYHIRGTYEETTHDVFDYTDGTYQLYSKQVNNRKPGDINFITPDLIHIIKLSKEYSEDENKETPMSITVTGEKLNSWGYYKPTEGGRYLYVDHKDYEQNS